MARWITGCQRRSASRLGVLLLGFALIAGPAAGNSFGPQDGRTGAPMEGTCGDGGCHTDHVVDSGSGELVLIVPPSYVPDETYAIDVSLSQEGQLRWGFELTVLDAQGSSVGSLATLDASTQVSPSSFLGRDYIKQTTVGTAAGQPDGHAWSFEWTAPPDDVGPITFYAAGNAADGNGASINPAGVGDFIYTTSAVVPLPEPGPASLGLPALVLAGVLSARRRAQRPVPAA